MPCEFDRLALFAYLDGEAAGDEAERAAAHVRACPECAAALRRSASAIAFLLRHSAGDVAAAAPASSPGAGFTASVMARIRGAEGARDGVAPATPARDTAPAARAEGAVRPGAGPGTAAAGDADRVRIRPTTAPLARVVPFRRSAAAAAVLAGAAAAAALFPMVQAPRNPREAPMAPATLEELGGVALRTDRRNDGTVLDVWVKRGDIVPTGEILHSPAPSTHRLSLPGRGRLTAGPSTWLVQRTSEMPGTPGEVALGAGSLVVRAEPDPSFTAPPPFRILLPGAVVETRGEVELSAVAPESEVRGWLASLPAPVQGPPTDPSTADPVVVPAGPAASALYVRARRGGATVRLAGSPAAVETLGEGQGLEVVGGSRFFRAAGDAPPAWAASVSGTGGATDPAAPGSSFAAAVMARGRSVADSLRALVADAGAPAGDRAQALAMLADLDVPRAVATAVAVADDPAVPVRSAAVRVMAIRASRDPEAARQGLRARVRDPDVGIAVAALRAIRTLRDAGAEPILAEVLRGQGAPATLEARVHAAYALTSWGKTEYVLDAAALYPLVEGDEAMTYVWRRAARPALAALPRERLLALLGDARAGVRAAALVALRDPDAAEPLLADADETVRAAAAEAFLSRGLGVDVELLREPTAGSRRVRRAVVEAVGTAIDADPAFPGPPPAWLVDAAEAVLFEPDVDATVAEPAVVVLTRARAAGVLSRAIREAPTPARVAAVWRGDLTLDDLLVASRDASVAVRANAARRIPHAPAPEAVRARLPELIAEARVLLEDRATAEPALDLLAMLANPHGSEEALEILAGIARSDDAHLREQVMGRIRRFGDRPAVAEARAAALRDASAAVATAAARNVMRDALAKAPWFRVPEPAALLDSGTPLVARGFLAAARLVALPGDAAAVEALRAALRGANAEGRLALLTALRGPTVPPLVPAVRAPFADADPRVRVAAVLAASESGDVAAARAVLDDPHKWVRFVALAAAVRAGDDGLGIALASARTELRDSLPERSPLRPILAHGSAEFDLRSATWVLHDPGLLAGGFRGLDPRMVGRLTLLEIRGRAARILASGAASDDLGHTILNLPEFISWETLCLAERSQGFEDETTRATARRFAAILLEHSPPTDQALWLQAHRFGLFDATEVDTGER